MKKPFGSALLDTAARLLIPYMLVFALYVLAHGHHSPGGGFQAGTVLAAAVILVRLVRGEDPGWGVDRDQAKVLAALGVLVYWGTGVVPMLFGADYLDYSALPLGLEAPQARSMGILLVEAGVTIGVMGTMILIFDCLTGTGSEA